MTIEGVNAAIRRLQVALRGHDDVAVFPFETKRADDWIVGMEVGSICYGVTLTTDGEVDEFIEDLHGRESHAH